MSFDLGCDLLIVGLVSAVLRWLCGGFDYGLGFGVLSYLGFGWFSWAFRFAVGLV